MKKIFSIITLLCLAMTSAWAQNAASADCAENRPNASRQKTKVVNSRRAPSAEYGNVAKSFECTSGYQYGIATDGTYIYTSSWSASIDDGYLFHQYDIDGNLIDAFNISGVTSGIRDMTYDGTYFYGATCSNTVYQMDFANKSLVGTFNIPKTVRAITYDSTNDGFWATGNWDGTLDLYDRSGNLIKNGKSCASVSGCAYCVDNDGEEHVLMCHNGNNQVYDYNITTNTLSEPTLDLSTMPNYSGGTTGGCFIGNYNGNVSFFADIQQGPQLIGIYDFTNILGSKGMYALSTGISEHGTLTFKVDNKEVTSANAGDVVTVTVTPDEWWTVYEISGQWYAAVAAARRQAPIDLLDKVMLTPVQGQTNQWTFTMQRANVEISATYKKALTSDMIGDIETDIYSGKAHTPEPVVTYNDKTLVKGTDFTYSYKNNVNAGTATVTITAVATSGFSGSASKDFTIAKKVLKNDFIADIDAVTYTGMAQTPAPVVTYNGMTLVAGTDYYVNYWSNVNAGTATVLLVGSGNFDGTALKKFVINPVALTAVTLVETNLVFNQQEQTAEVASVTAGTLVVPEDSYEVSGNKATNVGTYTVTVTGKGNFKGTATAQFSIVADNANTFALTLNPTEFVYDGQEKKPAVTVKDGETVLVENTDYTLAYANNVNAGTATVTATGKGNYSGTKTAEFTIKKAEVVMTAPEAVTGLVYNGEAQTLITAGSAEGGEMQYSLDNENFSTTLPTGTDAKEYTVYYKVVADANHNDVEAQSFKVTIATNKTALNAAISGAETYYNSIKDEFADVAATLLAAINAAKEVKDNADATQTKIETATTTLNAAVSAAEQAIAEQIGANQAAADAVIAKINAIGTVEYTDASKALIDAAREAYDALTDVQKALVSAETLRC